MKISANIDSVKLIDWHINTGEVNARVLDVEMSEELKSCSVAFVTFKTENEGTYESKVNDGVAEIPSFSESQWVEIGLYTSDMVNGELKKQYSPKPAKRFINKGSFCAGAEPPPKPTPGDYAELLEQIADLEKGTLKIEDVITDTSTDPTNKYQVFSAEVVLETTAELVNMMSGCEKVEHKLTEYKDEAHTDQQYYSAKATDEALLWTASIVLDSVDKDIQALKTELQGDIEDISALVGGAE